MSETNQNNKKEGFSTSNKKVEQRSGAFDKNVHHKDDKPIEINQTGVAPVIDSRLESEIKKDAVQKSGTLDDRIAEMNTTAVEVKTEHTTFSTNSSVREKDNEEKQKINIENDKDASTNTDTSELENTSPKTIVMFIAGIVIGALITSIIL